MPNWMLRGGIEVLTIRPKLLAAKFRTGLPKTTRFRGFCISMRNWCVNLSPILVSLITANDSSNCFGPRTFRYRGALPNFPGAGFAKAEASRYGSRFGSNELIGTLER